MLATFYAIILCTYILLKLLVVHTLDQVISIVHQSRKKISAPTDREKKVDAKNICSTLEKMQYEQISMDS